MRSQHPRHLGDGALFVHPVPGRLGDDHVHGRVGGGNLLGAAGENFQVGLTGGQHGAHPIVGLDGGDTGHPLGQEPREDAGAGADLEDVRRALGDQPVERLARRPGSEQVVLVRDLSEGSAQDGRGLVLVHARQCSGTGRDVDL